MRFSANDGNDRALIFWFTGLSGAGKTTLAQAASIRLRADGLRVLVLDGDDIRVRHSRPLGFSEKDIKQNNEIIASLCEKERSNFDVILVPIISPFESSRCAARERLDGDFYEIYCVADIDCLERRDVKGLYAKARRGEITDLIGFSRDTRYEPPENPDLILRTCDESFEHSAHRLVQFILERLLSIERSDRRSDNRKMKRP